MEVEVGVSLCNCRSTGGNDSMCHTFVGCTWFTIKDWCVCVLFMKLRVFMFCDIFVSFGPEKFSNI